MSEHKNKKGFKLSSTQTILLSFLITIFLGAFLLSLPIASTKHTSTDFLSCVFTATSSMCVTGLVVVDTATHWTFFGQLIILILIQLGGLGVIFVTSIIAILLGQRINLIQRTTLQEALSLRKVGGIIVLTKFIIKGVFLFESMGALVLFTHFIKEFDPLKAMWYSIFHSISAFCNAGFDLMGFRGVFSSLTFYKSNVLVNVTIMLLIVIGGLGFTVWDTICKMKFNFRKYTLQSKLVLITTLMLIIAPAIYFYFFEYNQLPGTTRVLSSLFQSVTTRTAGFNTQDFSKMSEVGQAISIMLMLIGGSPGSTAGGMKTTTIAILIISTFAIFRQENEAHIFDRRIEIQIVKNAITLFTLYLNLFLLFSFIICKIENSSLMQACFEVGSAIGTVGLSLSFTPNITSVSKIILIVLMFLGRIGGLTFIYAILPSLNKKAGYIAEDIVVG